MWNKARKLTSDNPNVWKYVFEREDAVAEAVLYRYPTFEERTVICCSTQSGCPVGCRFCGAGDNFVRSLKADEVVSQVSHLFEDQSINVPDVQKLQIMFMSMGEPLLNYKNLEEAIRKLHVLYPQAALLISSSGPKVDYKPLEKLSQEISTVGLQFSVHESTDEKRNELIPFKTKLNLEEIAETGKSWFEATGRKPFFNYCAGPENTSTEDANRLASMFPPEIWNCTISVICERDELLSEANDRQRNLAATFSGMMVERGFNVRVFDPAGQDDIGGGCGQLFHVQNWMKNNQDKIRPSVGYRLPVVHMPRV